MLSQTFYNIVEHFLTKRYVTIWLIGLDSIRSLGFKKLNPNSTLTLTLTPQKSSEVIDPPNDSSSRDGVQFYHLTGR